MAVESVKTRLSGITSTIEIRQLYFLLDSLRTDLETLRAQLNTHVHSGVTTGASNSGAPTTTISSLNTQA